MQTDPLCARRVLLAATGLTPQVVTETLYALMREGGSALPTELHIVTTAEGADRARLALLSAQPGWFHRLLADYRLAPIAFDDSHIHVLAGPGGLPLPDIRSADDNARAADQVAELVRQLSADDVAQLHVSLAGGRKTLGFFAGYALSLWGRDADRLSHVLVSEPYESSWDFFYPTPYERIVQTRDGKLVDCALAQVTLAELPFVRLRHGLPRALLDGRTGFADAVAAAQRRLGPARLVLHLDDGWVAAGDQQVLLPPADMAFLAWFVRRARSGLPGLRCPLDGQPSVEHAQAYLAEYRRIRVDDDHPAQRYRLGMGKAGFLERKSKLNASLVASLGAAAAAPYLIVGEGRRPMQYRLTLPKEALRFV